MANIDIPLEYPLSIAPSDLEGIGQWMPILPNYYVPLMLDRDFNFVLPSFRNIEQGGVALSLDRSFGFERDLNYSGVIVKTPKVNEIELRVDPDRPRFWIASLAVPSLTTLQLDTVRFGVDLYARHAATKADKKRQLIKDAARKRTT